MSEKDGGFPSAYSSFAVSVDSRNAERPIYTSFPPTSDSNSGILRQGRGASSPYNRPLSHEKRRSLSPRSQDRLDRGKPGVRFTKDTIHEYDHVPSLHHRRSSTAAFLEYIRTHLPESQRRGSIALTPKRGIMLFIIVFSATYLALGLMPMLASYTGIGGPVTVVIKRGDGYYGNSHIFRGGENLADPHLAGDEHHQYLAHAANKAQGALASHDDNEHDHLAHGLKARTGKQRTLKTSTLAEEASLKEIKVARAKAKAEALARAQLLAEQDIDEEADLDAPMDPKPAYVELPKAKEDSPRRRPLMPLKKLAEKVKTDRQAREKAAADKEEMEEEVEKEAGKASQVSHVAAETHDEEANPAEQDDAELEGIIAKLRQEALDRRLRKIHAAQRDIKQSHFDNVPPKRIEVRDEVDESRLRRPGIVKSRKVSTKED